MWSSLNWFRQLDPILCLFFQTDSQCAKRDPAVCTNCISVTRLDVVFLGIFHLKEKRMLKSHCSCLIIVVSMLYLVREHSSPHTEPVLVFWGHVVQLLGLKCPEQSCQWSLKTLSQVCTSLPTQLLIYMCTYKYLEMSREITLYLKNYRSKTLLVKKQVCRKQDLK